MDKENTEAINDEFVLATLHGLKVMHKLNSIEEVLMMLIGSYMHTIQTIENAIDVKDGEQ